MRNKNTSEIRTLIAQAETLDDYVLKAKVDNILSYVVAGAYGSDVDIIIADLKEAIDGALEAK